MVKFHKLEKGNKPIKGDPLSPSHPGNKTAGRANSYVCLSYFYLFIYFGRGESLIAELDYIGESLTAELDYKMSVFLGSSCK